MKQIIFFNIFILFISALSYLAYVRQFCSIYPGLGLCVFSYDLHFFEDLRLIYNQVQIKQISMVELFKNNVTQKT